MTIPGLLGCLVLAAAGGEGDWRVADGEVRQETIAAELQVLWNEAEERSDVHLRAHVTLEEGERWLSAGFALRAVAEDDCVLAYLAAGEERKVQVGRVQGGAAIYPRLQGWMEWPVERRREHALEVRARGELVNVLVDGRLLAVFREAPRRAGRSGLFTFDCRARFREVAMEDLAPDLEVVDSIPLLAPLGGAIAPAGQSLDSLIDRAAMFALSDQGTGGVTTDESGRPIPPYLCHAVVGAGNELSYGGAYNAFHHGLFLAGFLDYYVYSGIEEFRRRAIELAEWNLARRTPAGWQYANLPYSTTTRGEVGGLVDAETLQPDKAAFFGTSLLRLAQVTGEPRYREAAFRIGETLVATQRPEGNWYFRVHPRSGEPLQPYTASIIAPLRLLDALEADEQAGRFAAAREAAFDWLLANPVRTEEWVGYYEDVGPGARSFDQWMPAEAILYCLDHQGERPGLLAAAARMEATIERTFLAYYGDLGPGVREQTHCFVPMNFHTLHWALAAFDLGAATRNETLQRAARSAVNTATWNQAADGRSLSVDVFERGAWRETWYSLAFSPLCFGLPFLGRCPAVAPADENHLLRHSAAIQSIRYLPRSIEYEADGPSTDLLKLKDVPVAVACDGEAMRRDEVWSWQEEAQLLRVMHPGGRISIALAPR
ncbi:MAG: hypothetical protein AB1726_00745 [Planctomycetota bacterium]